MILRDGLVSNIIPLAQSRLIQGSSHKHSDHWNFAFLGAICSSQTLQSGEFLLCLLPECHA
jgi:hypothetical protein